VDRFLYHFVIVKAASVGIYRLVMFYAISVAQHGLTMMIGTVCCREELYKRMADILVAEGYRDAGYEYVAIDDCWMERSRDARGRLQADAKRFPSGIAYLADYVSDRMMLLTRLKLLTKVNKLNLSSVYVRNHCLEWYK